MTFKLKTLTVFKSSRGGEDHKLCQERVTGHISSQNYKKLYFHEENENNVRNENKSIIKVFIHTLKQNTFLARCFTVMRLNIVTENNYKFWWNMCLTAYIKQAEVSSCKI